MSDFPQINQVNENTFIIYFTRDFDINMPAYIAAIIEQIKAWPEDFVTDLTPSYTSLLVNFNLLLVSSDEIQQKLLTVIQKAGHTGTDRQSRLVEIPVYYSPESGLDLIDTAKLIDVSVEELIKLHSDPDYLVFALGFMPGFAFMGILNDKLILPRLSTPRTRVPAGSVAIAEKQTAVYPETTPGGWRLLGKSPATLFDPEKNPPQPYQIGDRVKFKPISKQQYLSLGGQL